MNESNAPATPAPPGATAPGWARPAFVLAGGAALAGIGLAAGMMLRSPGAAPSAQAGAAPAAAMTAAATTAGATAATTAATTAAATHAQGHVSNGASTRRAPHERATEPVARAQPDLATQPATLCTNCGVVEGVREVQREGKGTGLGAVAGGLLGGVVGHQMGGGNGKTALTVLGALGGGLAGNEIEKRQRSQTFYEVRVRMDDGTVRSFTQASAPAPGSHVTVDAQGVHVAGRAGAPAPEYVRVSGGSGS